MDLARLRTSMSSSDLSHSSGASNQSTRDTSPDSPHGLRAAAANNLAAKLDLVKLSDPIDDMDRGNGSGNPFRTASERRERPSLPSHEQQFRTAHQAKTNTGRNLALGAVTGGLPPRSIASTNWRAPASSGLLESGGYSAPLRTPSSPAAAGAYTRNDVFTPPAAEQSAGGAGGYQDGIFISNAQVDECYSYCIARPDGQFTRLVPVDMLPQLAGIPARQADGSGMIVLPAPGRAAPNGQSIYTRPMQLAIESVSRGEGACEVRGAEVNQVLHQAPASPAGTVSTDIQSHIDSIIASSPLPATSSNPKRTKIYCDKWIHDGTCAFTQQGCKYKHEMPSDKETQEKLGLFHGYPAWWKKLQVEQQRPVAPLSITTLNVPVDMNARLGHPTPEQEAPMGQQHQQAVHPLRGPRPEAQASSKRQRQPDSQVSVPFLMPKNAFGRGTRQVQDRLSKKDIHSSPFGPIAPPSKADTEARNSQNLGPIMPSVRPSSDLPLSNPYSMLASLDSNNGNDTKKEGEGDNQETPRR